jgi:hypothetical protein
MSQTTFDGPLISGNKQAGITGGPNTGYTVLSQVLPIVFGATLVQDYTFYLPSGSQIVDFYIDVTTAYNSATSATLSAGITSGGTEYVSGVSVKTAGRRAPTYSAAQVGNMASVGTNTTLIATVTSVGQPTAGAGYIRVMYVQTA